MPTHQVTLGLTINVVRPATATVNSKLPVVAVSLFYDVVPYI